MDILVPSIAILAFIVAAASRLSEERREEQKRQRIANRTNKAPWNRSKQ